MPLMASLLSEIRVNLVQSLRSRLSVSRLFSVSTTDDVYPSDFSQVKLPKSRDEFLRRKSLPIEQPEEPKLNKVAIIGLPNAGKSTLVNQLTGYKVTSVSRKVHTTRKNVIGVFNEGSTQVELLDTPGLVKLKHCIAFNLEHTLYNNPRLSAKVADLIAVLVDVSQQKYTHFLDYETFKLLSKHRDKKSILVLNKVDRVPKKLVLLDIVDRLTGISIEGKSIEGKERFVNGPRVRKPIEMLIAETQKRLEKGNNDDSFKEANIDLYNLHWPHFSKIFMISALTGDGVDELRDYMIETAKPCPWKYNEFTITNEDPQVLAKSIVREKFLDFGHWDTPYLLKFIVDAWDVDEQGNLHIVIIALCPQNNKMNSIIGPEGGTIARISAEARQELMDTFACEVRLKVIIKCTEKIEDKDQDKKSDQRPMSKGQT